MQTAFIVFTVEYNQWINVKILYSTEDTNHLPVLRGTGFSYKSTSCSFFGGAGDALSKVVSW